MTWRIVAFVFIVLGLVSDVVAGIFTNRFLKKKEKGLELKKSELSNQQASLDKQKADLEERERLLSELFGPRDFVVNRPQFATWAAGGVISKYSLYMHPPHIREKIIKDEVEKMKERLVANLLDRAKQLVHYETYEECGEIKIRAYLMIASVEDR